VPSAGAGSCWTRRSSSRTRGKQSQAVRAIAAEKRVALTGTPVENRLSELWSIMDFLNPGYLGASGTFRKKFACRSSATATRTKPAAPRAGPAVRPPSAEDRPEGGGGPAREGREPRVHAPDQASRPSCTRACVKRMLTEVDQAEGMNRRGSCSRRWSSSSRSATTRRRCSRSSTSRRTSRRPGAVGQEHAPLIEMLDEVMAEGDQALIFTQFRPVMGHMLAIMLRHALDKDVLFLHGGTPRTQRRSSSRTSSGRTARRRSCSSASRRGRRGPEPDRREPRLPLRPLVEPRGREPGDGPGLPHRPDADGAGAQVRRAGARSRNASTRCSRPRPSWPSRSSARASVADRARYQRAQGAALAP
jgi:hypothetical protein